MKRYLTLSNTANTSLLLLILITGCQSNLKSAREERFRSLFPDKRMNEDLKLEVPISATDLKKLKYRIGDYVELNLLLKSDNDVRFPNDFGLRLFVYDEINLKWKEIENDVTYTPPDDIILSQSKHNWFTLVTLFPKVDNLGYPIDIRVVVIGDKLGVDSRPIESVGAYIDITLNP